MIRVLEINDKKESGVSFYRSRMPFNNLLKGYDDVLVDVLPSKNIIFDWETLSKYNILFYSNPLVSQHHEIIKTAKMFNLKIWVDYDDNYFDIGKDCTSYNLLMVGHVNHMVKECLMDADIVTVTTEYLKECYKMYTRDIRVIPNGFPLELLSNSSLGEVQPAQHNFVMWRGSDSHRGNLEHYKQELTEVANDNPEWGFKFFGSNPWYFDNKFKYQHFDFTQTFDSFYKLKMISSKIHVVPLVDRPFNRSKSNIAYIEATVAGSVVLAPNWDEWQRPGIVNYESKQDFKEKLQDLISGKYDLTSRFEESKEYILNNLSLKKINRERIKILSELCVAT
jgi:hypothetical protein